MCKAHKSCIRGNVRVLRRGWRCIHCTVVYVHTLRVCTAMKRRADTKVVFTNSFHSYCTQSASLNTSWLRWIMFVIAERVRKRTHMLTHVCRLQSIEWSHSWCLLMHTWCSRMKKIERESNQKYLIPSNVPNFRYQSIDCFYRLFKCTPNYSKNYSELNEHNHTRRVM